jgi:hypothetical protein
MAITTIVKCEGIFGQQDRQIGEMSTIATALIGAHFCIVDSIETGMQKRKAVGVGIKKPEQSGSGFYFIG